MSKLDNEGKPIYRDDGKVLKGLTTLNQILENFLIN